MILFPFFLIFLPLLAHPILISNLNNLTIWWRRPNSWNRPARPTKPSLSTSSPPNPPHSHIKPRPTHARWWNSKPMFDTNNQQESPAITTNKIIRWVYAINHKNLSKKSSPTPSKNFYHYSEPTTIITLSSILQETVFVWVLEDRKNPPQEIGRSLLAISRTWTSTLAIAKRKNTWRIRPPLYSNKRQSHIRWSVSLSIRKKRSGVNWRLSLFSTMKRRSFSRKSWRICKQKMQHWRRKSQQCMTRS